MAAQRANIEFEPAVKIIQTQGHHGPGAWISSQRSSLQSHVGCHSAVASVHQDSQEQELVCRWMVSCAQEVVHGARCLAPKLIVLQRYAYQGPFLTQKGKPMTMHIQKFVDRVRGTRSPWCPRLCDDHERSQGSACRHHATVAQSTDTARTGNKNQQQEVVQVEIGGGQF
jgi:hypothetical protein